MKWTNSALLLVPLKVKLFLMFSYRISTGSKNVIFGWLRLLKSWWSCNSLPCIKAIKWLSFGAFGRKRRPSLAKFLKQVSALAKDLHEQDLLSRHWVHFNYWRSNRSITFFQTDGCGEDGHWSLMTQSQSIGGLPKQMITPVGLCRSLSRLLFDKRKMKLRNAAHPCAGL